MHTSCKYFALIVLSVTACFLTACATPPTTAQFKIEFAKGVAAYEAGDYQAARALWQPLADNYDLAALRNLGHLSQAMIWLKKAAAQGYPPAQRQLAIRTQRFEYHSR